MSSDLTGKMSTVKAEAGVEGTDQQLSSPSPAPSSDLQVPSSADKMDTADIAVDDTSAVPTTGNSRRRTARSKPSPPSSASQDPDGEPVRASKPKRERRTVKQEAVKPESPEPVLEPAVSDVDLTKTPTDAENKPLPIHPQQRTDGVEGTEYYW